MNAEDESDPGGPADEAPDDMGRKGWVLVAVVVFAVLVVPGVVYLRPAGGVLGSHYRTTMLVLPMVPAVLLGLAAVWSMTLGRQRE